MNQTERMLAFDKIKEKWMEFALTDHAKQAINDTTIYKKIWINHERIKLHVAASELYPEDYDFSIAFETVEQRKLKHNMDRKYVEETLYYEET